MRGIPKEFGCQDIQEDLRAQSHNVKKVVRIKNNKNQGCNMVLVTTDRNKETKFSTPGCTEVTGYSTTQEEIEKLYSMPSVSILGAWASRMGPSSYRCGFCAVPCAEETGQVKLSKCCNCADGHPPFFTNYTYHPVNVQAALTHTSSRS